MFVVLKYKTTFHSTCYKCIRILSNYSLQGMAHVLVFALLFCYMVFWVIASKSKWSTHPKFEYDILIL